MISSFTYNHLFYYLCQHLHLHVVATELQDFFHCDFYERISNHEMVRYLRDRRFVPNRCSILYGYFLWRTYGCVHPAEPVQILFLRKRTKATWIYVTSVRQRAKYDGLSRLQILSNELKHRYGEERERILELMRCLQDRQGRIATITLHHEGASVNLK